MWFCLRRSNGSRGMSFDLAADITGKAYVAIVIPGSMYTQLHIFKKTSVCRVMI